MIPPHKNLSIFHRLLFFFNDWLSKGLSLAIDFLFHSLASEQRENYVTIILSNIGAKTTLGLHAIKKNLRLSLGQSPEFKKILFHVLKRD